jgi:RimJ/RimL family protein N-acetyltransferase
MSDVRTSRLVLHAIDVAEGERILATKAGPADSWAPDFPFDGDVVAIELFLRASTELGEQRPFGFYLISRLSDGRAMGGIGFKSQPIRGTVEIGYGLTPSARGRGFAAEAVAGLLTVAIDQGLAKVKAETTLDNIASQRTLIRAGFRLVGTYDEVYCYEILVERNTAA